MPDILPAYAIDGPESSVTRSTETTQSLIELLLLHGKPYRPQYGYRQLQLLGLTERKARHSSKYPNKEKLLWSLM
ncbi:hypothetical protein [Candidatus Williamhamiltonella defendens]|uniref:hypothetical protein n=1 Tax=Candidatus Williamhamiltonella defendens TaxID=138072 RepID=UPI001651130C|nr:hypothetical protein [Candidatus Hamiltonella defensa]